MLRSLKLFKASESGAVTVDWVVLTATVMGIMFGSLSVFTDTTMDHALRTNQAMADNPVGQ